MVVAPSRPSVIATKLTALRQLLSQHHLDGYLIPSADEHLNEYLPEAKQRRSWISGFTGSAGDFLVGLDQAWVFADSRYYEQAELEVDRALIHVCKVGLEDHQTLDEILQTLGRQANAVGQSFRLGFDPFTLALAQWRDWQKQVVPCGVELVPTENWVDRLRTQAPWVDADPLPAYANSPVFALPDQQTGEAIEQKLARLRQEMAQQNIHLLPLTKLDQVAWLYNLRGWDVPYNPVFIAYAVITPDQAYLLTNVQRIPSEVQQQLQTQVTLLPYEAYATTLTALVKELPACRVLLDPKHTTTGTYQLLTTADLQPVCTVVEASQPIEAMKARKNAIEVVQMQQANLKASRAKTRTLKWIEDQLAAGHPLTEQDVATQIATFYAEEDQFQGLSFNTIAATGANSSIVHYGTPSPDQALQSGQFLLLDSGAQYASGTTDDTRTVVIGHPTPEQIDRYTAVLKAHINCAMQRFPKGTTGAQLDGITRSTMWFSGLDYGHGTGHGVGAFLNVHEGPNGISKRVSTALEPGMITSVEPGFYQPGWGGIRLENLYVVQEIPEPQETTDDRPKAHWYSFESLTYIPFDRHLIDLNQLDSRQYQWLQHYYQQIIAKLSPTLEPDEVSWLSQVCQLDDLSSLARHRGLDSDAVSHVGLKA